MAALRLRHPVMMDVALSFICCFSLLPTPQGLELSLDLNTPSILGHRTVCGILTCEESFAADSSNVSIGNSPPRRTISSLSIFKHKQPDATGDGEGKAERDDPFLTLTPKQPRLVRVSDGVKVDGTLKDNQATLRLEMVKDLDCSAVYVCEVRTSDDQGNQYIQTNRLKQRVDQREGETDGEMMTSGGLLQHLVLLQQTMNGLETSLDGKLSELGGKFVTLETRLETKFGGLSGQFGDVETRLDGKLRSLGSKFRDLQVRLDSLENRVEDKILSSHDQIENKIETRVVNRLSKLENKMSIIDGGDKHTVPQSLSEIKSSLETLKEDTRGEGKTALVLLNTTSEMMMSFHDQMTDILAAEQRNQVRYNNLLEVKDDILKASDELSQSLQQNLSTLYTNLHTEFDQFKRDVQGSCAETQSTVHDMIADTNMTMWDSLKPALFDILSPKECKKGMFPSLLGTAFPYHVIKPNKMGPLDIPYLCDSVTEGGGWIVIQRRTSGAVDFFRDWAAYRDGFGSLNDEFWLGNQHVHALTSAGQYELRVDLKYKGSSRYAHYSSFSLSGEESNFVLSLGTYDGTAGDSLAIHNGKAFSTYDRDHDGRSQNDAQTYSAGWWYWLGYHSNLNGLWGESNKRYQASWNTLSSHAVSFSEMKIRKI